MANIVVMWATIKVRHRELQGIGNYAYFARRSSTFPKPIRIEDMGRGKKRSEETELINRLAFPNMQVCAL